MKTWTKKQKTSIFSLAKIEIIFQKYIDNEVCLDIIFKLFLSFLIKSTQLATPEPKFIYSQH